MQNPPQSCGLGLTISAFQSSANDFTYWRKSGAKAVNMALSRAFSGKVKGDAASDCGVDGFAIEGKHDRLFP
ncbi:hypothetical protein [Sphingobium sp. EM0848]|uniref:hypothetical protein n=1 Tax=Sphingobium sp. EM0848 TaxID=2743473 RepID=UPI00159C362E|nr:hypothetical protein [Sphingobium sp. EM0848]